MKSIQREGEFVRLELERGEREFLLSLPGQIGACVQPVRYSTDPAIDDDVRALLDAERASARVRRREEIVRTLHRVGKDDVLVLTLDEADAWLADLAEWRLALASQIGIVDERSLESVDAAHPPTPQHRLYFYLTALQGLLLQHGFGVS